MRVSTRLLGSTTAVLMTLALAPAAHAQMSAPTPSNSTGIPTPPQTGANDEARASDSVAASLTPVGAHFGSFSVLPKVEAAVLYDSNIYSLQNATNDGILKVSPSITANGDFGTYTNVLRVALDRYNYFNRTRENRTDYAIGGNHRLEMGPQTFLTANAAYSRNHEDRGDPNATFSNRSPTVYKLSEANAGLSRDLATLRLGVDGGVRYYNFDDARQIGGGITNNDDRDRLQARIAGRLGFQLSPGYAIIGRVLYDSVNYDSRVDDLGFDRDSKGLRLSLGIGFELTRLLTGEVFGGYLRRSYDDARFETIKKPLFGTALTWYPTELTTVRFNADRSVEETVLIGYNGYLATTASISVDHELMRTLRLSAGVRYAKNDYKRGRVAALAPRDDDNYGASLSVRYTLNRNLYTGLGYDYTKRTSNVSILGSEFSRHKVLATVGLQF